MVKLQNSTTFWEFRFINFTLSVKNPTVNRGEPVICSKKIPLILTHDSFVYSLNMLNRLMQQLHTRQFDYGSTINSKKSKCALLSSLDSMTIESGFGISSELFSLVGLGLINDVFSSNDFEQFYMPDKSNNILTFSVPDLNLNSSSPKS